MGTLKSYYCVQDFPFLPYELVMNYQGDEKLMRLRDFFGLSGPPSVNKGPGGIQLKFTDFGSLYIEAKG